MKVLLGIVAFVAYVLLADWLFGRRIEFTLAAVGFGLTVLGAVLRLWMVLREASESCAAVEAAQSEYVQPVHQKPVIGATADERRAEQARLQALLQTPRGSARLERVQ